MELKIEVYSALCSTSVFTINGKDADYDDFGKKYDRDSANAEDYACADMRFTGNTATPEVLAKYGITEKEYDEVVSELEDKLSFGCCGWCV